MNPNGARVLLLSLSERTSAKGNRYLSGWLGKASVVAFPGEPDKFGNETWDVFVSTPEPKPADSAPGPAQRPEAVAARSPALHQPREGWRGSQYRRPAERAHAPVSADGGWLVDDPLDDLGRR